MTRIVRIRKNGLLTIPKEIRKRYCLEEGGLLTIVDLGEGLFLSPKRSVIPQLVAEIETLRQEQGVSLDDLIRGVAEQRKL